MNEYVPILTVVKTASRVSGNLSKIIFSWQCQYVHCAESSNGGKFSSHVPIDHYGLNVC